MLFKTTNWNIELLCFIWYQQLSNNQNDKECPNVEKQLKRVCNGPLVDASEIVRKCSKSTSVVKSLKLDVTNIEITKEEAFKASGVDEITDTKENIVENSPLSKTVNRFDGDYLNSTGVQLAITETFQQLKQCHSRKGDVQTGGQVTDSFPNIVKYQYLIFQSSKV